MYDSRPWQYGYLPVTRTVTYFIILSFQTYYVVTFVTTLASQRSVAQTKTIRSRPHHKERGMKKSALVLLFNSLQLKSERSNSYLIAAVWCGAVHNIDVHQLPIENSVQICNKERIDICVLFMRSEEWFPIYYLSPGILHILICAASKSLHIIHPRKEFTYTVRWVTQRNILVKREH